MIREIKQTLELLSSKEVEDVFNQALENVHSGRSKFNAMTYEEGVVATLRWLMGEEEAHPMED